MTPVGSLPTTVGSFGLSSLLPPEKALSKSNKSVIKIKPPPPSAGRNQAGRVLVFFFFFGAVATDEAFLEVFLGPGSFLLTVEEATGGAAGCSEPTDGRSRGATAGLATFSFLVPGAASAVFGFSAVALVATGGDSEVAGGAETGGCSEAADETSGVGAVEIGTVETGAVEAGVGGATGGVMVGVIGLGSAGLRDVSSGLDAGLGSTALGGSGWSGDLV